MRETLDCAVLMVPMHACWMREWMTKQGPRLHRVRLHAVVLEEPAIAAESDPAGDARMPGPQALANMAMRLRRFDACVLPVTPATLGWTRTVLSCARSELRTPVLALARDLKAAAVQDLLALGLRDFMREPTCPEELRARLGRVVASSPASTATYGEGVAGDGLAAFALAGHEGDADLSPLREPHSAYQATASRRRMPRSSIDTVLLSMQAAARVHPDEPFRTAKSRVVDSFERDYVRTALSRHAGNVARAARASAKHRRAFWALMRKHDIDAAPYRSRDALGGECYPADPEDDGMLAGPNIYDQGDGRTAGKIRRLGNFQG
jgi:CheY-like chemotaxis protein